MTNALDRAIENGKHGIMTTGIAATYAYFGFVR